jgi:hypothetical protein
MLRVTMEIVPFGVETGARTLYSIYICNKSGTAENGNYAYIVRRHIPMENGETFESVEGTLKGFPRTKFGALSLLKVILKQVEDVFENGKAILRRPINEEHTGDKIYG